MGAPATLYNEGARRRQDCFDTRCLADRIAVSQVFPNCPRYVHPMQRAGLSDFALRRGHVPPVSARKRFEMFRDFLAADDPARDG